MVISSLTQNPFQAFDLTQLEEWRGIPVNLVDDAYFEGATRVLEDAFQSSLRKGRLLQFVSIYVRVSKQIIKQGVAYPKLAFLLQDALKRLVHFYMFLRRRTRSSLAVQGSSFVWQIPQEAIAKAREAATQLERDNVTSCDYDLNADPTLKAWVMKNVQPIVREYVGSQVITPWAHIRYADAARHAGDWSHIYDSHPFAYFHLDEMLYSIPLIIYLTDVNETSGPFSYVEGTDKIPQNWVLRSFYQALCHGCKVNCDTEAERRMIAELPSVFRGHDLVGTFTGPAPFKEFKIVKVTGPAGTALISDGFQLVHAGGHPKEGKRLALFIAFRYPQKRMADFLATIISKYWSWRVGLA